MNNPKYLLNFLLGLSLVLLTLNLHAQEAEEKVPEPIPYGNNPEVGKYFDSDGVKLYYEIYGEGDPILMLHGGVFGYIDEFTPFIDLLSKTNKVICLATRGHGKSEIGKEPNTYKQRATDANNLLKHLSVEKALAFGFSDGGYTALKMAALYPESVTRVLVIGIGDNPKDKVGKEPTNYTAEGLMSQYGGFFEGRIKLMPEPERWNESLQMLNGLYNDDFMSEETFSKISCPTFLLNGEKDEYTSVEALVKCYRSIPNASLAIIPNCSHVVFYCNFQAVWESIKGFLK